jgi:ribosomal-protein-alanine N-acetyltransferase
LILRRPAADDIDAWVELLGEPSVARGTLRVPFPYTRKDGQEFLGIARRGFETGRSLSLVATLGDGGEMVGGAGLHRLDPGSTTTELGYWIGRPFRRRGYASELAERLTRLAFSELGLHRVEAAVFPFNRRSMGVLRKAGFRREGLLREIYWKDGAWLSGVQFSRLATDPAARAPRRRPPPA